MSGTGGEGGLRGRFAERWWTLDRFGLTPRKLTRRLRNREEPSILCVSIPKSGTHLLERALCLHPRLYRKLAPTLLNRRVKDKRALLRSLGPGQIAMGHLRFLPQYPELIAETGVRPIFLIRDPRDVVVSLAHYTPEHTREDLRALFASAPEFRERLRLMIVGDRARGLPSIGDRLQHFSGWLDTEAVVVRFEDLIGPSGGGDAVGQRAVLASIYRGIGLEVDDRLLGSISARLFSSVSPTFRQGSIGQWRQHFDPELERLFRDETGDHLGRYGYETAPPP
jgi:hypothetical protein